MGPGGQRVRRYARAELTLGFPDIRLRIAFGTGHLDLLDRPEVYATIKRRLESDEAGRHTP